VTWKNSNSITAKLPVFINEFLRKVLRIFWPDQITDSELWKRTKQPRTDLMIRKREWGWPGHTLRKLSNDIARQALEWNPKANGAEGGRGTWQRVVLEGAKGVKKTGQRIKVMPRIECDGGFLWKPYIPWQNEGILYIPYLLA
jgi:hypothetical protein